MGEDSLHSPALAELTLNATAQDPPALEAWRGEGGHVLALAYGYVPEEIFTAAGIVAYRPHVIDNPSTALAQARFTEMNCTYVRTVYDAAKRGVFDFCEGVVSANACDHERRMFDNWVDEMHPAFSHFVFFPKKSGELQAAWYRRELEGLVEALRAHFGVALAEDDLRDAIELHNETRRLQRALYELRRAPNPPITGAEALAVMMAANTMPRQRYNRLLAQLLDDCQGASGHTDYRMRAFLYGGELDTISFVEAIESQGALVVGDYLGFGYRACAQDVTYTGDALADLARTLVDTPMPRLFGTAQARKDLVRDLMRACDADGAIVVCIPLCDYWRFEQAAFDVYAKEHDIPALNLDHEYIFNTGGRVQTRVQAFVEAHGRE